MAQTTIKTEQLADDAVTSAKLDTNIAIAGTLGVTGEITANGGIALGDNDKATFGASDDLEIFHGSGQSFIRDTGDGNLYIQAEPTIYLSNLGAAEIYAAFNDDGAVTLYHNNAAKLATTSTGIDVTGTVTSDGLTVDAGSSGTIDFGNVTTAYGRLYADNTGTFVGSKTNEPLILRTNNTERMRIDASGNVGVAGAPPAWGSAYISVNVGSAGSFWGTKAGATLVVMSDNTYFDGTSYRALNTGVASKYYQNAGAHYWDRAASVSAGATQSSVMGMMLDANGRAGIGIASVNGVRLYVDAPANEHALVARGDTAAYASILCDNQGASGTRYLISFRLNNSEVGKITSTGANNCSLSTGSDYRLKENVVTDWDATTRLKQLKPSRFNFISDADTTVDGFIAHEVQDIVPEAIVGAKDAMKNEEYEVTPKVLDDDGNVVTEAVMGTRSVPDYQGIDHSKLVPLLTKALQEALTKIEQLEARLKTLEDA